MCCCKIGLTIYGVLQLCILILFTVGTPLDQFRAKNADTLGNTACLTLWGCKSKCYSTSFSIKVGDMFDACPGRSTQFKVAETFGLLSIIISAVALILVICMCTCCKCCSCGLRIALVILTIAGVATGAVVWCLMVTVFHADKEVCPAMKNDFVCPTTDSLSLEEESTSAKYGAGFALVVVGWALQVVNILIILLPC